MLLGNRLFLCLIVLLIWAVPYSAAADATTRPLKVYAHYMGAGPRAAVHLITSGKTKSQHCGMTPNRRLASAAMFATGISSVQRSPDRRTKRRTWKCDGPSALGLMGSPSMPGQEPTRPSNPQPLFKVAEEKNYPFEITICIDPNCLGKESAVIKYLLDKHGNSPKLARRDGKPLIFGYQSVCLGIGYGMSKFAEKPEWKDKDKQIPNSAALRATTAGLGLLGQAMEDLQKHVGQPLYIHYCMSAFDYGVDRKDLTPEMLPKAAAIIAKHVGAIGSFGWLGPQQDEIGKAVLAAGAEWSCPVGMYEKENIPYECYMPPGPIGSANAGSGPSPGGPPCSNSSRGTITAKTPTSRPATIRATPCMN